VIPLSPGEPLVEVVRNGFVESVHSGHLVVLDASGQPTLSLGEPNTPVFPRSSMKPLQTKAILDLGVPLDVEQTALSSASHSGSRIHLSLIADELAAAGLSEHDLACPPDLPYGEDERRQWLASGQIEQRLAMNCSGKHTAMLRACLAMNWPISGYLDASHPLQESIRSTVEELAGERVTATAVDGCGAPVHAVSLIGLARAFQRITTAPDGSAGRVASAMRAHPELVGGEDRFVTRLMRAVPGLIAKEGAESVYGAALPDGGAIALKVSDGSMRACDQAVLIGLRHLGVDPRVLEVFEGQPVLGGGQPVGVIRPIAR
jgi:L-asparaginase II